MVDVLIVGGGYAGYALARELDAYVKVTLVEAREAFVHNVGAIRAVTDPDLLGDIVLPYDRLLKNGEVVHARATKVDASGVTLDDGRHLAADQIVLATGSGYAVPFKPQGDSAAEFSQMLRDTHDELRAARSVAIVGGGAVGVELAGEIAYAFPEKKVTLATDQKRLFPAYADGLHEALVSRLEAKGVKVLLGHAANRLSRTDAPYQGEIGFTNGRNLEADLIFPATGSRVTRGIAHELPGVKVQPNGQIIVDKWLRPSNHPNIFVIGDVAATGDGMTVVAITRQVPWLVKVLRAIIKGQPLERQTAYRPWRVAPILLPLGPRQGASVLPFGSKGFVVGDKITARIKGRELFVPRYRKEFGLAALA